MEQCVCIVHLPLNNTPHLDSMFPALETIQSFVAPVVVISANGLLCLAFYNRMASVISRLRTINKERFDLHARLSTLTDDDPDSAHPGYLKHRVEILDELGHQLFDRVRVIRDSLIFLLVTVLCMLGCSLALGLAPAFPQMGSVALVLFVSGVVIMILGVARAIQELRMTLSTLLFEHDMLEKLPEEQPGEAEFRT